MVGLRVQREIWNFVILLLLTLSASALFAVVFYPEHGWLTATFIGVASGLTDTLTNESVTLTVNGDGSVVTGTSATGGVVFTLTLNKDTGSVTLDQLRAVVHADTGNPDDSRTLSAADLITLTGTIIDGDSDSATATLNIASLSPAEARLARRANRAAPKSAHTAPCSRVQCASWHAASQYETQ
jgi:hypothetical protein